MIVGSPEIRRLLRGFFTFSDSMYISFGYKLFLLGPSVAPGIHFKDGILEGDIIRCISFDESISFIPLLVGTEDRFQRQRDHFMIRNGMLIRYLSFHLYSNDSVHIVKIYYDTTRILRSV